MILDTRNNYYFILQFLVEFRFRKQRNIEYDLTRKMTLKLNARILRA